MSEPIPKVYLYRVIDGKHQLFLGGYSTAEGVGLLANDSARLTVSAAYFEEWGDSPELQGRIRESKTVSELASALIESCGLHDFTSEIESEISLSTHDDSECLFSFSSKSDCEQLLLRAFPCGRGNILWSQLTVNQGLYICFDSNEPSELQVFADFDGYLESLRSAGH